MLIAAILQTSVNPEQLAQAQKLLGAMLVLMPVIYVVSAFIRGLPYWFICKKAGFSPWLSCLFLIPMGGLILSYVMGFADWKVVPAPQMMYMPPMPPYPPQA
ncbi:MAG TPA: hypothetical protein VGJ21_21150 [Terracidiphilus sp.]|jgi:hypothetical protein